ncbi:DUF3330 domain-containing protein [Salmonella enterica subsp. enterica serovar Typhimurium]|uniref:DUF3330 domain-containing protein n=1 Tax=Salmonella enterica TaxID=28901 RepID=UPI001E34B406|nr:DUF3330 domain-containing protein [Salmonella enterica]
MKMPAFEWVHVQLHQQKGMISLSPPTICNSACGLECYQRFQARASTATETSVKPDACDSPPSG